MQGYFAALMAKLLTGRDLKYKNNEGEIKIPNFYEEKGNRLYSLFRMLSNDDNNYYVCVYINDAYVNMRASEYLNNRLDYIKEKIKDNRLQLERNWLEIVLVAIVILVGVWEILVLDLWQSKEGNRIKKVIKSLGCFMALLAHTFIWIIFIASLFVWPPLEILCSALILSLFLSINAFFTVRFLHKQKLDLCQKFENKYQEIKNFINECAIKDEEDAKTQASESEYVQQENNNPVANQDNYELIIFEDSRS